MEFWKYGGSETSSEENDRPEKVKDGKGPRRRSYECTYCRRGFTNAQALGGHMNIHRKDRAKAKEKFTSSSPSFKPHEEEEEEEEYYIPYKDFAPFSTGPEPGQRNQFPAHFQLPEYSFSGYPHSNNENKWSLPNSERLGANLSLQIGPTYRRDSGVERAYGKEDEVDLELRLGHYP